MIPEPTNEELDEIEKELQEQERDYTVKEWDEFSCEDYYNEEEDVVWLG